MDPRTAAGRGWELTFSGGRKTLPHEIVRTSKPVMRKVTSNLRFAQAANMAATFVPGSGQACQRSPPKVSPPSLSAWRPLRQSGS
jgi:hypothetical protein